MRRGKKTDSDAGMAIGAIAPLGMGMTQYERLSLVLSIGQLLATLFALFTR